jgi:hypothetical protein
MLICPPALIYLIFSLIQIILDSINGLYNVALVKIIVATIMTFLLNVLCQLDLGIISWIIVLIPFLFMALITMMLLYIFGMDIVTGEPLSTTTLYPPPVPQPVQPPSYMTSPPYPPQLLPNSINTDYLATTGSNENINIVDSSQPTAVTILPM